MIGASGFQWFVHKHILTARAPSFLPAAAALCCSPSHEVLPRRAAFWAVRDQPENDGCRMPRGTQQPRKLAVRTMRAQLAGVSMLVDIEDGTKQAKFGVPQCRLHRACCIAVTAAWQHAD